MAPFIRSMFLLVPATFCVGLAGCAETKLEATPLPASVATEAAEAGSAAVAAAETATGAAVASTADELEAPQVAAASQVSDEATSPEVTSAEPTTEDTEPQPQSGRQTSMVGPKLPEGLKWLQKDDWLTDWRSAFEKADRPLVLRPDAEWPLKDDTEPVDEAIATDSEPERTGTVKAEPETQSEADADTTASLDQLIPEGLKWFESLKDESAFDWLAEFQTAFAKLQSPEDNETPQPSAPGPAPPATDDESGNDPARLTADTQ